jgi:hypothetical protein
MVMLKQFENEIHHSYVTQPLKGADEQRQKFIHLQKPLLAQNEDLSHLLGKRRQ